MIEALLNITEAALLATLIAALVMIPGMMVLAYYNLFPPFEIKIRERTYRFGKLN